MDEDQINWLRARLEEAALQYTRLKTLGYYCEKRRDGKGVDRVRPCHSDISSLLKLYTDRMNDAAIDLLREMTVVELPERDKS